MTRTRTLSVVRADALSIGSVVDLFTPDGRERWVVTAIRSDSTAPWEVSFIGDGTDDEIDISPTRFLVDLVQP